MKEILRERSILYLNKAKQLMTRKNRTFKQEISTWDLISEYLDEAEFLFRMTI